MQRDDKFLVGLIVVELDQNINIFGLPTSDSLFLGKIVSESNPLDNRVNLLLFQTFKPKPKT